MKVFTKVVWQWKGDSLVRVYEESHEYTGPVALAKGGGSGGPYYDNLNRLYGTQASSAEYLNKIFQGDIGPAYQQFLGESKGYGSIANQEQAATQAAAAGETAMGQSDQALSSNLMSMGIDPSDQRYQETMAKQRTAGAGLQAANINAARQGVRDQGLSREQAAIGLGMGVPGQAAQASNAAGNAANIGLTNWNQQQAQQAQSVGNIARLGTNYFGDSNKGGFADGGPVGILRLQDGGYIHKMAGGGFLTTPMITPPPPAVPTKPQANPVGAVAGGVTGGAGTASAMGGMTRGAGSAIEYLGRQAGSDYAQGYGLGLRSGASGDTGRAAVSATQDYARKAAMEQVDNQLGLTKAYDAATQASNAANAAPAANAAAAPVAELAEIPGAAGELGSQALLDAGAAGAVQGGAEAATVGAATAGAEGLAGLGAGSALAAGIGTAVPVIGAGLAAYTIGNQLGWWADGGPVGQPQQQQGIIRPGSNGASGGEVDGPGGPKDDKIHAMLSDGEYVMPRGAVLMYGLKHLDGMRQKGLEYEQQVGITRH